MNALFWIDARFSMALKQINAWVFVWENVCLRTVLGKWPIFLLYMSYMQPNMKRLTLILLSSHTCTCMHWGFRSVCWSQNMMISKGQSMKEGMSCLIASRSVEVRQWQVARDKFQRKECLASESAERMEIHLGIHWVWGTERYICC